MDNTVGIKLAKTGLSTVFMKAGKLSPMQLGLLRGPSTALAHRQVLDLQTKSTLVHRNGAPLSTIYQ